jgi:hypothetical protein
MVDNNFLELQLSSFIDVNISKLFPPQQNVMEVSREQMRDFCRMIVEKSIEISRQDFVMGVRRLVAISNLEHAIEEKMRENKVKG